MEIATIILPPYLYNPKLEPEIRMRDNRRFTMRDIANLEKRIENLEQITSLSALELDTNAFQVKDKDGLNRFKKMTSKIEISLIFHPMVVQDVILTPQKKN